MSDAGSSSAPGDAGRGVRLPNPFRNVYLSARPFQMGGALVVVFVAAYVWAPLLWVGRLGVLALAVALVADLLMLWATRGAGVRARRDVPDKLSLGDENEVRVDLTNAYPFRIEARVLDEVPVQFQERGAGRVVSASGQGRRPGSSTPSARPSAGRTASGSSTSTRRRRWGSCSGGSGRPRAAKRWCIRRSCRCSGTPSSRRRTGWRRPGVKKVRRLGHTMEFDQIRPYVPGDDRRSVNWKATARRSTGQMQLMVNTYEEERAQPVVAALDMGRAMRSPFDGLTLLDHAVNASLVLLNTALLKHDKAGLVTFDREVRTLLLPDRRRGQLPAILDALYRLDPGFTDPSYEDLYATLRGRLRQRSLVLLFTNVDTRAGLERQLPYLRQIARMHRLVVVLFENTGIRDLLAMRAERLEDVYVKTVAEGLAMEKREIARTLERHGIGALLTRPETLTVDAVNRYLQIKARGAF